MKNRYLALSFLFLFLSINSFSQSTSINKIKTYLKTNYPTTSTTSRNFIFNAIDLNDDGKDEFLVGLIGGDWCGSGGCTMLVLNSSYKLITRMTVVNYPVFVGAPGGKEVTKGYSNIYIQNNDGSVAKMEWDGKKYPSNPSVTSKVDKRVLNGKFKFLDIKKQKQFKF